MGDALPKVANPASEKILSSLMSFQSAIQSGHLGRINSAAVALIEALEASRAFVQSDSDEDKSLALEIDYLIGDIGYPITVQDLTALQIDLRGGLRLGKYSNLIRLLQNR